MRIKNPFHVNGFAPSHTLKQRLEVTQKWPLIILFKYNRLNNILSIVERHQLEKRTVPWAKKKKSMEEGAKQVLEKEPKRKTTS